MASSSNDYRLALVTPDNDQVNVRLNFSQNNLANFETALSNLITNAGANICNGNGIPESTDECLNTVVNALAASGRLNTKDCAPTNALQIGDFAAFRPNARKLIVMVTDAPPGGFCDTYNTNVDNVRAHEFALVAKNKGIKIDAIAVEIGSDYDADVATVMQDYANTTCGWYYPILWDGSGMEWDILSMFCTECQGSCP